MAESLLAILCFLGGQVPPSELLVSSSINNSMLMSVKATAQTWQRTTMHLSTVRSHGLVQHVEALHTGYRSAIAAGAVLSVTVAAPVPPSLSKAAHAVEHITSLRSCYVKSSELQQQICPSTCDKGPVRAVVT